MRTFYGKKQIKWFIRIMLLGVFGVCMLPGTVFAKEQTGTFEGHPLFKQHFGTQMIIGKEDEAIICRGSKLSAKYDPREQRMVSAVENQGSTDTCWAFATTAAIESNLIRHGYEKSDVNLSEKHLAYFFYHRTADRLGGTKGDSNKTGTNASWAQNGGNLFGPAMELSAWSGVVKQTTCEDNGKGEFVAGANLPADACYKSDYRVKNVFFYNYNVKEIKRAVMDYGAVATGIHMSDSRTFWNPNKNAYYYSGKADSNHAVVIVGWDDNFSRNSFNKKPKRNGAWIVKNSWGTEIGEKGYFYVSYEDTGLNQMLAYDMEKPSESYDNNYQYDGTGNYEVPFALVNHVSVANVFQAKGAGGHNEILKAVSIASMQYGIKYSLQVYTGVTSKSNPASGKKMFAKAQTGTLSKAGYQRIVLKEPVTLQAGEKYAVVLKLSAVKGDSVVLDYDYSYDVGWIHFVSKVGTGQSFIGKQGKWQDIGKGVYLSQFGRKVKLNLRMKAYTDSTGSKTSYKLSNKSMNLSKGTTASLKVSVSPETIKRKIKWFSSDKKIVTVSGNGKVKAKKYGTATVNARLVSGNRIKTLKCRVTVGPIKMRGFRASGQPGSIVVEWQKNPSASGYVIYYSDEADGTFETLATITDKTVTGYTKDEIVPGIYYIKMRPYRKKGNKKLFGSDTEAIQVVCQES